MTATTTNLLLIRHGLTDYVTAHRMPGWQRGIHLNDEGHAQAAALARRLAGVNLAAVYSSPLERAVETAAPLSDARGLSVSLLDALIDLNPGDWTDRLAKDLAQEALWASIQAHPGEARLPGGESFQECQARMVDALSAILGRHPGQTVAVVSHADPIKMVVAHFLGLPLDLFRRLSVSPASVTVLAFEPTGPCLICLNYTDPPVIPNTAISSVIHKDPLQGMTCRADGDPRQGARGCEAKNLSENAQEQ